MRREVRNAILASALGVTGRVVRLFPLATAQRLGRAAGSLAWRVDRRNRDMALRSLETAFPDMNRNERESLALACFKHLGTSLMEVSWLPNLDAERMRETTEWEGLEHLRQAVDQNRGVVLFTGHCGNWEWMAASIALAGFEMNVIAREIEESRFNDYIVASRGRFGIDTIGRGSSSAAREIIRTLRSGSILGVLIDQNIQAEIVRIPFFGIDAPTPVGPAKLAVKSGSMAIAGFTERRNGRHHIRFEPPIDTRELADPREITRTMTESIEKQIQKTPEQWVWMHRRWRDRGGQREMKAER
ncbi:MAG: lysophospholipid acyltransferase family protein [Thermoanaerobaculia bacterium]|nr:lysophospholipid acyltransferase family protein [Thermoanaerobaculia bacterium]